MSEFRKSSMAKLTLVSIVFILFTVPFCEPKSQRKRIAIIGGGISGASTSFFVTQVLKNHSLPPVDITVFERRDYIGGRLKHISYGPDKLKIEIGGAAWTDDNIYMTEMANAVGVNVTRKELEKKQSNSLFATESGNTIDVWDGSSLINLEKFYFDHLVQGLKVGESELKFLKRVKENYAIQQSSAAPFHNLTRLVQSFHHESIYPNTLNLLTHLRSFMKWGNLGMYTNTSISAFFSAIGASSDMIEIGMVPLNRAIYNQGSKSNAFGFLASLTSQLSQHTVKAGNSELVKALFNYSNSRVLLSTNVTSIRMDQSGEYNDHNLFTVNYNNSLQDVFDAVVIASPLEVTDITFENIKLTKNSDFDRGYFNWYVTVVEASSINMSQFPSYEPLQGIPNLIVTTTNSSGKTGFVVMQPLGRHTTTPAPKNVWMVYSDESILQDIDMYFNNPKTETVFEHFWPYTFPHLKPIDGGNVQPIILNEADGGGIYNANAMESIATAMEISSIGGRNVALLIEKYLFENTFTHK